MARVASSHFGFAILLTVLIATYTPLAVAGDESNELFNIKKVGFGMIRSQKGDDDCSCLILNDATAITTRECAARFETAETIAKVLVHLQNNPKSPVLEWTLSEAYPHPNVSVDAAALLLFTPNGHMHVTSARLGDAWANEDWDSLQTSLRDYFSWAMQQPRLAQLRKRSAGNLSSETLDASLWLLNKELRSL